MTDAQRDRIDCTVVFTISSGNRRLMKPGNQRPKSQSGVCCLGEPVPSEPSTLPRGAGDTRIDVIVNG